MLQQIVERVCERYIKPVCVLATFFMFLFTLYVVWIDSSERLVENTVYLKALATYIALLISSFILYRIYNPK